MQRYIQTARYLGQIQRISHCYVDSVLKEKGVRRGQVPFLMELYHHDGVTQDYLAQMTVMDKSTVARALHKLEADGFVRREQNPADKRENLVYLTAKGREIHPLVHDLEGEWVQKIAAEISDEEFAAFEGTLEKLRKAAKDFHDN